MEENKDSPANTAQDQQAKKIVPTSTSQETTSHEEKSNDSNNSDKGPKRRINDYSFRNITLVDSILTDQPENINLDTESMIMDLNTSELGGPDGDSPRNNNRHVLLRGGNNIYNSFMGDDSNTVDFNNEKYTLRKSLAGSKKIVLNTVKVETFAEEKKASNHSNTSSMNNKKMDNLEKFTISFD